MHRFGLVVPFLDTQSVYCLICVCRSGKAEIGNIRELDLECRTPDKFKVWEQEDGTLERIFRLDCSFYEGKLGPLCAFLSSRKLQNLRVLRMPEFFPWKPLTDLMSFPLALRELSTELGGGCASRLGRLPRLTTLRLVRTIRLDLALLARACPSLTSLDLDVVTSQDCQGELSSFDSLTSLRVENWDRRVPTTVLHLEIGARSVLEHEVVTPSNIEEISRTIVSLDCGFPWPGIDEWPRLEELRLDDCNGDLKWEIKHAPALHTFESVYESTFATKARFPQLRILRIRAPQLHIASDPAAIRELWLRLFDPKTTSLSEFTGLRALRLEGGLFCNKNAPKVNMDSLEEFTFFGDSLPTKGSFHFLKRFPNLRRLKIESSGFPKPFPMLQKLTSIECDFFHKTLFQPQVQHLKVTCSNPSLLNSKILEALKNCKDLESLQMPLRPGLKDLILRKHPLLVVAQTMSLV